MIPPATPAKAAPMAKVNAPQLRGVAVGPHGQDGRAAPRTVQDDPQDSRQQEGCGQTSEADVRDDDATEVQPAAGISGSDRAKIAREDQQQQADDHQVDAERQQEGEEERCPDHPVDDTALQRVADHEKRQRVDRKAQEWIDVKAGEEHPGDVRADDHQGAMRQIDDVEDAPDEAEPQRHRDIDSAEQEAEDDLLRELAHEISSASRTSVLARAPGRCRILRRAVRYVAGKDRVMGPVLDLLDDHRLEGIDPAAVELDLTEEGHDIQAGRRVAHLARIEGTGILDRLLRGEECSRRLRNVIGCSYAAAEYSLL